MSITGIYKIQNQVNGKVYVGQSVDIYRRWREERAASKMIQDSEYDSPKSRAFRKYGIENFTFEVIEECPTNMLNLREQYWTEHYNSYAPYGYNVAIAGEQGFHFTKLTLETFSQLVNDLQNTRIPQQDLAAKYGISLDNVSKINVGARCKMDKYEYPLRSRSQKKRCPICNKIIDRHSDYCVECAAKRRQKVDRPDAINLAKEIINSNFSEIGRQHGVSDNTIRKWCKKYGIPTKKEELKEWLLKEELKV